MHLIAVEPIHDKFWKQCPCRCLVNTRQTQGVVNRRVGLPIAVNTTGFRTVLHLARMSQPAASHMLNESAINLFGGATALTPIQHELRPDRVGKRPVDAGLSQNFQGVLAGLPVLAKGRRRTDFEAVVLRLPGPPLRQYVLSELGFDFFVCLWNKALPNFIDKCFGHTVVQNEQIYQCAIGYPGRGDSIAGAILDTSTVVSALGRGDSQHEHLWVRVVSGREDSQLCQFSDQLANVCCRPERELRVQLLQIDRRPTGSIF